MIVAREASDAREDYWDQEPEPHEASALSTVTAEDRTRVVALGGEEVVNVAVQAVDLAGNVVFDSAGALTLDFSPPTLTVEPPVSAPSMVRWRVTVRLRWVAPPSWVV